jgi:hypothetical protein
MESKIPIPTDNIFKFYALFALFLFVFSIGSNLYINQSTNRLILDSAVEKQRLLTEAGNNPVSEVKIATMERELKNAKTDRTVAFWLFSALAGAAFWLGIYGFNRWHKEVQPRIDEASRVQLEIAKLQLAKLRAEVAGHE